MTRTVPGINFNGELGEVPYVTTIRLPEDPRKAQALRDWVVARGFEDRIVLKQKNGGNRRGYPRNCKHGHVISSEEDEIFQQTARRCYWYCRLCRLAQWTRNNKKKQGK